MLRDTPKIYMMFFALVLGIAMITLNYSNNFNKGASSLQLNEVILSSAVENMDYQSRMHQGAMLLTAGFEDSVWGRIVNHYPDGFKVQFAYLFDITDARFTGTPSGVVKSPTYVVGGASPLTQTKTHMLGFPVRALKLYIKDPNDNATEWTYTATIKVDAQSRP